MDRVPLRASRRAHRRRPGLEPLESRRLLSTITVTTTADSGPGSLRDALTRADADTSSSVVEIAFAIPGTGVHVIQPASALPAITREVILDGSTQPGTAGTPLIVLDGSIAGMASGLTLASGSDGSMVKGLAIDRFSGDGIDVSFASGESIVGNVIGVDPAGAAAGNGGDGILATVANATIGGTAAGAGNVIAANGGDGIHSSSYTSKFYLEASSLLIEGNAIGTDAGDSLGLGNLGDGIFAQGSLDTIGGTAAGAGNVIAANGGDGIATDFATLPEPFLNSIGASLLVQGNAIGTDPTGALHLGNAGSGVDLGPYDGSTIGGTAAGAGNVFGFDRGPELANLRGTVDGNRFAPGTMFATPAIAVSESSAGVAIGDPVHLAFTVTNNGPDVATHVRIQFQQSKDTYTVEPGPATPDPTLADTYVVASIAPGGSAVIHVDIPAVNPDDTVHATFTAMVLSLDQVTPEISPGAFSASASVAATDLPVVAISAGLDPYQPTANQLETLTYTVTNTGDAPATNVLVTLTGLAVPVVSVESSQGTAPSPADFAGGSPVANLGTIAPGGSATLTVEFLPDSPGAVESVATASYDQYFSIYYNPLPTVAADFTIAPAPPPIPVPVPVPVPAPTPDLAVTGIVQAGVARVGQGASFAFVVTNHGAGMATDVILAIAEADPSGVSFVEYLPSQGRVEPAGPTPGVTLIDLGPLAPGASASVALDALPTRAGLLMLTAAASSPGQADPTPLDNLAFAAIAVAPEPLVSNVQVHAAGGRVSAIQVYFSEPQAKARAQDARNYQLSTIRIANNRPVHAPVAIKSARYDAATNSVTLRLAGPSIFVGIPIDLVVDGPVPFLATINDSTPSEIRPIG